MVIVVDINSMKWFITEYRLLILAVDHCALVAPLTNSLRQSPPGNGRYFHSELVVGWTVTGWIIAFIWNDL